MGGTNNKPSNTLHYNGLNMGTITSIYAGFSSSTNQTLN